MTNWETPNNPNSNPGQAVPFDPATVDANANPGQSTPFANSADWQAQARAAGWQSPEQNSGFQQSSPQTQPTETTPVDIGAGSSPMTVPLTPENRSGMATANINKDNGLPDEMSLSDVFSQIKLHPTEIASLLSQWAGMHYGGPNQNLANKLNTEAVKVADPRTYKNDSNR